MHEADQENPVEELLREERSHGERQVEAARRGDLQGIKAREESHERLQRQAAQRLLDYERVLTGALLSVDTRELLDEMLARTRDLLQLEVAMVFFRDDGRPSLRLEAAQGLDESGRPPQRWPTDEGFLGQVWQARRAFVVHDGELEQVAPPFAAQAGLRTLLGVPMFLEGQVVGVFLSGCRLVREFDAREVNLLQIVSDRIAVALDRAKLLERERRRREQAEQESQHKSDLFRMATHDLRTPLTALRLQVDLLRLGPGDPRRSERALEILDRNLRRLDLMLNDFLDLARLEAGRFVLHRSPFDLQRTIHEVVDTLAPKAREHRITLTSQFDGSLPMVGDERRLVQVLHNLLGNAVRYTPDGGRVEIAARSEGSHATVRITDNGVGMTEEQRAHLFEPFMQMHGASGERRGSGLGLYLSRRVVEEHGGRLEVSSPGPGRGLTVTVTLPSKPDLRWGGTPSDVAESA